MAIFDLYWFFLAQFLGCTFGWHWPPRGIDQWSKLYLGHIFTILAVFCVFWLCSGRMLLCAIFYPFLTHFAVFCLRRAQLWPTIYNNRLKMHLWIAIIAQISRQYHLYIYKDLLRWSKFPWEHNQSQVTSSTQLKNKISCFVKVNIIGIPIFCTPFYFMYLIDIGQNFVDIVVNVVAGIGIRPSQHPQHQLRFS